MMRRLLQPLWILLALIFLIEAWLWDHLEPVVARVVAVIPLRAFKAWLAACVARLSPAQTLVVFAVPLILLFPLKLVEVWLLRHHYWISAVALIVASKFIGVGVLAFIFDVTRDKLLQMAWFRRVYEWVLWARVWAHGITEPVRERLRQLVWLLKPQRAGRFLRHFMRLRRNAYRNRAA